MKRIALLAAAALASGCVVEEPFGDVAVYWSFLRHTSTGAVTYDCAQAGVDYVLVTDLGGYPIDPLANYVPGVPGAVPCVFTGVEGVRYQQFASGQSYTFVVHAYRDFVGTPDVELFSGQGTVTVGGGRINPLYITAPGIQGDLDVNLYEGASAFVCLSGDTLGYTLVDGLSTIIDQVTGLTCGNPIAFRVASSTGVDLDNLDIRVQVTNTGTVVLDSCVSQPFDHFANDTGVVYGWPVALYATCI